MLERFPYTALVAVMFAALGGCGGPAAPAHEVIRARENRDLERYQSAIATLEAAGTMSTGDREALVASLEYELRGDIKWPSLYYPSAIALNTLGPSAARYILRALARTTAVLVEGVATVQPRDLVHPHAGFPRLAIGATAVLAEYREHADQKVRMAAIFLFPSVAVDECSEAVTALLAAAQASDRLVERQAVNALAALGRCAVPLFAKRLSDRSPGWTLCLRAIALMPSDAREAQPALVECLEHDLWSVRWLAARTLIELGGEGKAGWRTVRRELADGAQENLEDIIRWVRRSQDRVSRVLPELKAIAASADHPESIREAARALVGDRVQVEIDD